MMIIMLIGQKSVFVVEVQNRSTVTVNYMSKSPFC